MHDTVTSGDTASPRTASRAARSSLLGIVLAVHRYLAVAIAALMTLWCLSGFVMMYQGYPALSEAERVKGLAPLDFAGCCRLSELPFEDSALAPDYRLEMLLGRPVLRAAGGPVAGIFDLRTGFRLAPLTAEQVAEVAADYGRGHGLGEPVNLTPLEIDQWTVQSARRNLPVYKAAFADAAATEIYVSAASGEVFQDTTRRERILGWLGAIPHWLYPLELRRNGPLWSQIVIWASLLGTFLAATGIYVGIARLRRRAGRLESPFRGWWYWHHVSGLVFGLFTLTWVFSGLLTMNPWVWLAQGGSFEYVRAMRGSAASWREVKQLLNRAPALAADKSLVQLSSTVFDGRLQAFTLRVDGRRMRLDGTGLPSPLQLVDIDRAVQRLGVPVVDARLLDEGDSYYYRHKNDVELPVYRVLLDDAERTGLYVNPVTGSVRAFDSTRRASRWLRVGLHDLDFAGLRVRPVWDVVVGLLLLGVTATCAIGTWLALQRLRRDFVRLRRLLASRPAGLRAD